jgi:hypothetical protein
MTREARVPHAIAGFVGFIRLFGGMCVRAS